MCYERSDAEHVFGEGINSACLGRNEAPYVPGVPDISKHRTGPAIIHNLKYKVFHSENLQAGRINQFDYIIQFFLYL